MRNVFSPGRNAFKKMTSDGFVLFSLFVVVVYISVAFLSFFHLIPVDFSSRVGPSYSPPSWIHLFGTDFLGRSTLAKVIHGAEIAIQIGFVASVIAIPIGATLGALSGYFGGWVDHAVVWLYSTISSIPQILLLLSLNFVLGRGMTSLCLSVGLTSWVGICRLIRAEVLKNKNKEYVLATQALGASHSRILFRHILPNVSHLLIIDFSLRFIYAIKSEAILSYLGLGVQGEPSWGIMISDAKEELLKGIWWQLTAATAAMFFIVLALNILGDALRDALDPRTQD